MAEIFFCFSCSERHIFCVCDHYSGAFGQTTCDLGHLWHFGQAKVPVTCDCPNWLKWYSTFSAACNLRCKHGNCWQRLISNPGSLSSVTINTFYFAFHVVSNFDRKSANWPQLFSSEGMRSSCRLMLTAPQGHSSLASNPAWLIDNLKRYVLTVSNSGTRNNFYFNHQLLDQRFRNHIW